MTHFLDGTEPGRDGVLALARRALALRAGAEPARKDGRSVAMLFLNPSLRTRSSMELAIRKLGAHPLVLEPGRGAWELEFRDGVVMDGAPVEHVADAVKVLAEYADAVALRAFGGGRDRDNDAEDRALTHFVRHSPKPVISLESAMWHPLQGLADTATWVDRLGPELAGRKLVLTWAPHPRPLPAAVPNQVVLSAALQGMEVVVAHPEGMDLAPAVLERAQGLASEAGGSVAVTHDQHAAVEGAAVVVAKSWMGWSEYGTAHEEQVLVRQGLAGWRVDEALMDRAPGAGFMHCLPVRRNVVVTDGVLDGPRSWHVQTAGLRHWTALALLEDTL